MEHSVSMSGGLVLPLLGAVPDSAIIIVSGLGEDAQTKLSVGMGYGEFCPMLYLHVIIY